MEELKKIREIHRNFAYKQIEVINENDVSASKLKAVIKTLKQKKYLIESYDKRIQDKTDEEHKETEISLADECILKIDEAIAGFKTMLSNPEKWSLILFDWNGTTTRTTKCQPRKDSTFGKDNLEVEVLFQAETQEDLELKENEWYKSDRAIAIHKEISKRYKPNLIEKKNKTRYGGFIDVKVVNKEPVVQSKNKDNSKTDLDDNKEVSKSDSSLIEHMKGIGRHMIKHKSNYGLLVTIVLLLCGCDMKDIIEIIRLFDPRVSNKIYEIFVVLINKTDDAPKINTS